MRAARRCLANGGFRRDPGTLPFKLPKGQIRGGNDILDWLRRGPQMVQGVTFLTEVLITWFTPDDPSIEIKESGIDCVCLNLLPGVASGNPWARQISD